LILKLDSLDLKQELAVFVLVIETGGNDFLGDLRLRLAGQPLDGFFEAYPVKMAHKVDDIAAALASPAMPNLFF
jgi:hypothetical protein